MNMSSFDFVTFPLTSFFKEDERVPHRSGLNWGQRPSRNLSQGYLSIPAEIQRLNFFPDKGIEFTIICDDNFQIKCVRTQQNRKAVIRSSLIMVCDTQIREPQKLYTST